MSEEPLVPDGPTPTVTTDAAEPAVAAAPVVAEPDPRARQQARFTGEGREYFQIWIVNLLLTIVTLGVYSAWAKVRRLQYFYRHTRLAGAGFDYHGRPIAILKGRIVAVMLFGAYTIAGYFSPLYALAAAGVIALLLPWLLAKSFRFRLFNTSYRGMRFHFHGSTRSAYWVFLGLPALALLSLFTLVPFVHHRIRRYQIRNAAYGRTRFTFGTPVSEFYLTYVATGAVIVGVVVAMFVTMIIAAIGAVAAGGGRETVAQGVMVAMAMIGYVLGFVAVQAFFNARLQNAVWESTQLGAHRFVLNLRVSRLFGIMLTNLLATIVTIGLYRPFAQVRLARYYAESFFLDPGARLDEMAPDESMDVTAIGEETADIFDFDFSF